MPNAPESPEVTTESLNIRVVLDFDPNHMERLTQIMEMCNIKSTKDIINVALSLFEWSVYEAKSGRAIASVDMSTRRFNEAVMPALTDARNYSGRLLR